MADSADTHMKIVEGEYGYVLEDVPHLTDYIPDLPVIISSPTLFSLSLFFFFGVNWLILLEIRKFWVFYFDKYINDWIEWCLVLLQTYPNPLRSNPAYSVVKYVMFSFFIFNACSFVFWYIIMINHYLGYFILFYFLFEGNILFT